MRKSRHMDEVDFFFPDAALVARAPTMVADRDWREFRAGERNWTLQTYLRLRDAGLPVRLTAAAPTAPLVVVHTKHTNALLRCAFSRRGVLFAGIRGDLHASALADVEILQNRQFADDRRRFFVPHWPQPGMLPRDTSRGTDVRNVAFKGVARTIDRRFLSEEWTTFLDSEGLQWDCNAIQFTGTAADAASIRWEDYREVDVLVAVRPSERRTARAKPATKLYNAWLAGVPAILGAEPAYRELRLSELDYLEVATLEDAKRAVMRLKRDPVRYQEMVENGRRRAAEFSVSAITEVWQDLLFDRLPQLAATTAVRRQLALPAALRWAARRAGRPFRSDLR